MGTVVPARGSSGGGHSLLDSVGSCLAVTPEGRLDAYTCIEVGPGPGQARVETGGLDFSVLAPMVTRITRSRLVVAIRCGPPPKTSFLARVPAGEGFRTVKTPGGAREMLTRSLEARTVPLVLRTDLEKALACWAPGAEPIPVSARALELREHIPPGVAEAVRALVLEGTGGSPDRRARIESRLKALRRALRASILEDYLMKCVWLNVEAGQLGSIRELRTEAGSSFTFRPFDADDAEVSRFLLALEKDTYGDFVLDFREFANVLPTPKRSFPWLGPSVHVFKEDFRREHGLDEYYSLHGGFKALRMLGAPVLIYRGQNPLLEPTPIRFLKVSDRSLGLLQGRFLDGSQVEEDVRGFTAQELVWC